MILSSIALAISLASVANAHETEMLFERQHDNTLIADRANEIALKMQNAGISTELVSQAKAAYISYANATSIKNGDSENAEITCKDFNFGNFAAFDDCNNFSMDESNTTADILYLYHPKWSDSQKSKGEAFKAITAEVEKANRIFGANTPVKFRLVGFEQPSLSGHKDFDIARFGQANYDSLVAAGYDEFPNAVDPYKQSSITTKDKVTGKLIYGADDLLMIDKSYVGEYLRGDYDYNILPSDVQMMVDYGADLYVWGRLRETDVDPVEATLCGSSGGNFSHIYLTPDTLTSGNCPLVMSHELGHSYRADHDLAHKGEETNHGQVVPRTRATAAPCGSSYTLMYYASIAGLQPYLSSPDVIVNGSACGDERTMNNAKQVTIAAPFVANIADTMNEIGDVWFASEPVTIAENAGVFSIKVQRNGDLSKPASVKVFIDNGYKLLNQDFIDVKFGVGQSVKDISLSTIDNDSTKDNPVLSAQLVTPRLLKVKATDNSLAINITNNDKAPTDPTNPTNPTNPDSGSSGGSLGFLSLLILVFARTLRK